MINAKIEQKEDICISFDFKYHYFPDKYLHYSSKLIEDAAYFEKHPSPYKKFFIEAGSSLKMSPFSTHETSGRLRYYIDILLGKYSHLIAPKVLFRKTDIFNFAEINENILFVYLVTIGSGIDEKVKELSLNGDTYEAYILNAIGAAAAEMTAIDLSEYIADTYGINEFKRRSPGYKGYPLQLQKEIFNYLKLAGDLGVFLSESCLMIPEKSTSGFIIK